MVQATLGGSKYSGGLECGGVLGTRLKRDQILRCGRSEDNVADEIRAIKEALHVLVLNGVLNVVIKSFALVAVHLEDLSDATLLYVIVMKNLGISVIALVCMDEEGVALELGGNLGSGHSAGI